MNLWSCPSPTVYSTIQVYTHTVYIAVPGYFIVFYTYIYVHSRLQLALILSPLCVRHKLVANSNIINC